MSHLSNIVAHSMKACTYIAAGLCFSQAMLLLLWRYISLAKSFNTNHFATSAS
ncbi:unnamed protein product [Ixodes pacificus]